MATNRQQGRENRKRVFDYVAAHGHATRSQVTNGLGISSKSSERHLLHLYEKHFLNRYPAKNRLEKYVFEVGGLWKEKLDKAYEHKDFYAPASI